MFAKVIVAEDIDSINSSILNSLNELHVVEKQSAKYCDEAFTKIQKALNDGTPYELLITDLSFKEDHVKNKLKSGETLIEAVKDIQPDIKIIVLSIEEKTFRIKNLFTKYGINSFVLKGRNSIPELKKAIEMVFEGEERYLAPNLNYILQNKMVHEIDDYDIQLLLLLSYGVPQEKMEERFVDLGIKPSSKSSIEKRINKLKTYFKANNTIHLVAIAKDLGLI